MFERILTAVDDSPSSAVTLSFVAALAHERGASVHVLNVNEILSGQRGHALLTDTEAARLVEAAVRELRAGGIEASGSVVCANSFRLPRAIADVATDRKADVIVLGSRRRPRPFGRLSGRGLRERVIAVSPLPVMVAPAPLESGPARGAKSVRPWAEERRPQTDAARGESPARG